SAGTGLIQPRNGLLNQQADLLEPRPRGHSARAFGRESGRARSGLMGITTRAKVLSLSFWLDRGRQIPREHVPERRGVIRLRQERRATGGDRLELVARRRRRRDRDDRDARRPG